MKRAYFLYAFKQNKLWSYIYSDRHTFASDIAMLKQKGYEVHHRQITVAHSHHIAGG